MPMSPLSSLLLALYIMNEKTQTRATVTNLANSFMLGKLRCKCMPNYLYEACGCPTDYEMLGLLLGAKFNEPPLSSMRLIIITLSKHAYYGKMSITEEHLHFKIEIRLLVRCVQTKCHKCC